MKPSTVDVQSPLCRRVSRRGVRRKTRDDGWLARNGIARCYSDLSCPLPLPHAFVAPAWPFVVSVPSLIFRSAPLAFALALSDWPFSSFQLLLPDCNFLSHTNLVQREPQQHLVHHTHRNFDNTIQTVNTVSLVLQRVRQPVAFYSALLVHVHYCGKPLAHVPPTHLLRHSFVLSLRTTLNPLADF
jgi:hypothetical protein